MVDELNAEADDSAHPQLPVDDKTRAPLPHREHAEQMFGESFAGVQAHTGADLSSLGAQAAAKGETVAFEDKNPSRELVAHEMTHVVQQRKAGGAQGKDVASEHSGAEREAEEIEGKAGTGARVHVGAQPAGAIHLKRKHQPYAPTDQFNKKQTMGRPAVKVGGKQTFKVGAKTKRWSFIAGKGVTLFDEVEPGSDKNHALTVNIAQPRLLTLPDGIGAKHCVMSRTRLGGSAWIPVDALDASEKKLLTAAEHAAGKFAPAAPKGKLRELVFKERTKDHDFSLTANHNSQSRAQYDHYLHRKTAQPDGFFNVSMSLPQHGKVPTAVDVARPNDRFFVMQTREVPLYENDGGKRPVKFSHWAFGCMGKVDANGAWHPDKSRRGWVPLEALT